MTLSNLPRTGPANGRQQHPPLTDAEWQAKYGNANASWDAFFRELEEEQAWCEINVKVKDGKVVLIAMSKTFKSLPALVKGQGEDFET